MTDIAKEDCIICMERNLALLTNNGKYNAIRMSCCGTSFCLSCKALMEKTVLETGIKFICPICRSLPVNNLKEDFDRAMKHAKVGRPWGLDFIGSCYINGRGVPQSDKKAFEFYSLAAATGYATSQFSLGGFYSKGIGCKQSHEQAFRYYHLAADQNMAAAQTKLGYCYCNGEGVEKDYEKASHLYSLAANEGEKNAQHNLAICYILNQGVEHSFVEAIYWLKQCLKDNKNKELCAKAKQTLDKVLVTTSTICSGCAHEKTKLTLKCGKCLSIIVILIAKRIIGKVATN